MNDDPIDEGDNPPDEVDNLVTLIGPTQSGKTHLFSAVAYNGHAAMDLTQGEQRVSAPSFNFDNLDEIVGNKLNIMARERYDNMISANQDQFAGTELVLNYTLSVSFHSPSISAALAPRAKKKWYSRASVDPVSSNAEEDAAPGLKLFRIVDGRGGDLTSGRYMSDPDKDSLRWINEHYQALLTSKGALICLPWRNNQAEYQSIQDVVNDDELDGLESLLKDKRFSDEAQVKNIAVCLTKYEKAFLNFGANGYRKAVQRDQGLGLVHGSGYFQLFQALETYKNSVKGRKNVNVRIFPCSAYGFVAGRGAANFYPSDKFPGLLTRKVTEKQLEQDPELRNHFPVPIDAKAPQSLWHPFNVGSPFFFAITGRNTGPLSFSLEEVMNSG